ncbi:hypothetical protein [Methylobacterium oxalidis]|uniref:Uncharacterized protein n=1 Tax=Methylobacterium oxalidis TaxID=944322 RepID=A0A512J239_9HYPH|nr:hypothetical protein [Methylobacterium oxalidis]GEP04021.1 hypothetical protein MOX02_20590 [Methylobacterium oxalidis]GJE34855.1 hypothetical protein LDDCCGHA_5070 [Methylobacterium oxalidis]GLS64052.1 hypothetical protein GCM10007888_24330 [Methylobacterium oxalidis]
MKLTIEGDAVQMAGDARTPDDPSWPAWLAAAHELPHSEVGAVHQIGAASAWFLMTSGGRVVLLEGDWLVRDAGGELHRFSDAAHQRMAAG